MSKPKASKSSDAPEDEDLEALIRNMIQLLVERLDRADEADEADVRDVFAAVTAFHEAFKATEDYNLCLYWDVRIERGDDTLLVRNQGSTSMPYALGPKMRPLAPSSVQTEISRKVIAPLLIGLMEKLEQEGNPL